MSNETQELEAAVVATDAPSTPAPAEAQPVPSPAESSALEVFKEVPDYDSRTLVLMKGEEFMDLQFCGCVNKYKRRFSGFLKENPDLYTNIKESAISLAEKGYQNVDVRDILGYLKIAAKGTTPAKEYLLKYSHDFEIDSLHRAYLLRKLMMEEPSLFKFFELSPIKCRSGCGYGHDGEPAPAKTDDVDIAGF